MPDYRARVFCCYPRRELPEVVFVTTALERAGIDTWRDAEDIRPGSDWSASIVRSVGRADVMLVFLGGMGPTPQQTLEIEAARKASLPMIPVLLSDYGPDAPPAPLDILQAVDLRPGFGRLIEGLAVVIRNAADSGGRK